MSDLKRALWDALTDGQLGYGSTPATSTMLSMTRAAYGSVVKAAAAIGVNRSTFYRIANGTQTPRPETRQRLEAATRRAAITGRRSADLARGGGRLFLDAEVTVSGDKRRRRIDLSRDFTRDTRTKILRAYVAGDLDAAADIFTREGLGGDYIGGDPAAPGGAGIEVGEVYSLEWR